MKLIRLLLFVCVCAAVITAAPAVCAAENEQVQISVEVTDCAEGEGRGKIRVVIDNFQEGETYYISLNNGKTFYKTQKSAINFSSVKPGFYRVRAQKGKDKNTLSDTSIVYVGGSANEYGVKAHIIKTDEKIYRDGKCRIVIDNYDSSKSYTALLKGYEPIEMKGRSVTVCSLKAGDCPVRIVEGENCSAEFTVQISSASAGEKKYIKVEPILQNPELPTGCEVTSLTMLLRHMGYNAEKTAIADKYLEKGEYRKADPRKVFVGDPREKSAYGCYAAVIKNTAEKYLEAQGVSDSWGVQDMTGCELENLYAAIDNGYPVIVWVTIDMKEPAKGADWIIKDTGERYVWTAGEHCVLLTGYDKTKGVVYMNDPLKGTVVYDKALFEERFSQMGNNAVVIVKL